MYRYGNYFNILLGCPNKNKHKKPQSCLRDCCAFGDLPSYLIADQTELVRLAATVFD